jgi:hypothetical protein
MQLCAYEVKNRFQIQLVPLHHGASEKQRRDRINAMIDELRVLVPSSAAVGSALCTTLFCSQRTN